MGWNPIAKWWIEKPEPNMKTFYSHSQTQTWDKDKTPEWSRKDPDEEPSTVDSGSSVNEAENDVGSDLLHELDNVQYEIVLEVIDI